MANAVLDGTDAVMLSDETAVGVDPVRACRAMLRIIEATEEAYPHQKETPIDGMNDELRDLVVFSQAAVRTARECGARAIVTWSRGGIAARLLSRQRPEVPIVAPSRYEDTWRRLALPYAVRPVLCPRGRMSQAQLERELGPLDGAEPAAHGRPQRRRGAARAVDEARARGRHRRVERRPARVTSAGTRECTPSRAQSERDGRSAKLGSGAASESSMMPRRLRS